MIETVKRKIKRRNKSHNVLDIFYDNGVYKKHIGSIILQRGKPLIYYKKVNSVKHKMRLFNGYGIQKEVFDKFLRGKKGEIIIDETDTGARLKSDIKTWEEHSKSANYGEEKQVFLSVKYMEVYKPIYD